MTGIFITTAQGDDLQSTISYMDKVTRDWEMRAARGECSWVCADCCCTFPEGMPDECAWGHQSCTDIIQRDKRDAAAEVKSACAFADGCPEGCRGTCQTTSAGSSDEEII